MTAPHPVPARASALLIMLWAISLLSAAVLGLALFLDVSLEEDAARAKAFRARQLAESGLALAMHPQVESWDPLLRQEIAPGESFRARVVSEGARFNPNAIVANEDRDLFLDIFTTWGLTLEEASRVTDCLFDWIDDDDLKGLQGAERADYAAAGFPQYPRNRPFESISEMAEVFGMDLVERVSPDWRDAFTVWSQGKIDVNEADAEILGMVTGAPFEAIDSLVSMRFGLDGEPDTEDDFIFETLDQVRTALGMSQIEFDRISHRLSTGDTFVRVESVGDVFGFTTRISAITRETRGASREVVHWIEP